MNVIDIDGKAFAEILGQFMIQRRDLDGLYRLLPAVV